MGLTAPKPTKKISLPLLLDQLDSEWLTDKNPAHPDAALRAYVHAAARIALHWISGDPYNMKFPEDFQTERLAKLCGWLKALEGEATIAARTAQVAALRQVWPAYADVCTGALNDSAPHDQEFIQRSYTWDGLDTLWQTDESAIKDQQIYYLPQFHCRASEDFHLVVLAVVFLNRASKRRLVDLEG